MRERKNAFGTLRNSNYASIYGNEMSRRTKTTNHTKYIMYVMHKCVWSMFPNESTEGALGLECLNLEKCIFECTEYTQL